MGIDSIGKPPKPSAVSDVTAPNPGAGAAEFRDVLRSEAAGGPEAVGGSEPAEGPGPTGEASPVARLERGEIGVEQYLEQRVDQATAHLQGHLSTEQFEFVKESLREQLATDPVLVELARRATAGVPSEADK